VEKNREKNREKSREKSRGENLKKLEKKKRTFFALCGLLHLV
jgi:hypothetical protein